MKRIFFFLFYLSCVKLLFSQPFTQIVKGTVRDAQTTLPIQGATLYVEGSSPIIGTSTNADGVFRLTQVPLGRITLVSSFIGYQTGFVRNIVVVSGKETYLEISLQENSVSLNEVVVKARKRKDIPNNEMSLISSRSFNVDEALRYAGSWSDPARMALSYAGVAPTTDSRNDLVVRGNSPNLVKYYLENIEVTNPNHFGTNGGTGGAINILSQNILGNSDFLTGAFPAQYSNSLGAIFDVSMRKGNSDKNEFSFLFGMRGIELTSEGPIRRKNKSSYLVNYRYSTLAVFNALNIDFGYSSVPTYQDLSFKLMYPIHRGSLKLFGFIGAARINLFDSEVDDPKDYYMQDKPSDLTSKSSNASFGLSYKHFFSDKTFGEAIIRGTQTLDKFQFDSLVAPQYQVSSPYKKGDYIDQSYSFKYVLNSKINANNTLQLGTQADYIHIDYLEKKFHVTQGNLDYKGSTMKLNGFAQWKTRINQQFVINGGINIQYYQLPNFISIEPRLSGRYQLSGNQSISLGVGLHSQEMMYSAYFIEDTRPDGTVYHKYADANPLQAFHNVLGYSINLKENILLKAEAYYQYLFGIPVEKTASYWSALNLGGQYGGFPEDRGEFKNTGTGSNIGLELTLEHYLVDGFYYLLTASIYNSTYKGSDGIERNTQFNNNFAANALIGKEFKIGHTKQNALSIALRTCIVGGQRILPIDEEKTMQLKDKVYYLENESYKKQHPDYFRTDLKVSYSINRKKATHQIGLDIQNITNNQNIFKENYNISTNTITKEYQTGLFPEIQYKIMF